MDGGWRRVRGRENVGVGVEEVEDVGVEEVEDVGVGVEEVEDVGVEEVMMMVEGAEGSSLSASAAG